MKNYIGEICRETITDYSNGLLVKIKDQTGRVKKTVPVHKGDCDERLGAMWRQSGFNTNASMELSFFSSDEERDEYMKETL